MDATILGTQNELVNLYATDAELTLDVEDSDDGVVSVTLDVTGATLLRNALNEFLRSQGQRGSDAERAR